jgi:Flp pilus assembly protein TadG
MILCSRAIKNSGERTGLLKTRRRSTARGVSMIELCVGLIVLLPVVFTVFDLAVIVVALGTNDEACREAARLAAAGDPLLASQRAGAAVARANEKVSKMANNFTLVSCVLSVPNSQLLALQGQGGQASGSVTVTTQVDIYPFIVHWAYAGTKPLKFASQETYPFSYMYSPPHP